MRKIIYHVFLYFTFIIAPIIDAQCPCGDKEAISKETNQTILLCLLADSQVVNLPELENTNYFSIKTLSDRSKLNEDSCDVAITISGNKVSLPIKWSLCPGSCRPIPEVVLPMELLRMPPRMNERLISPVMRNYPLTCSLTMDMVLRKIVRLKRFVDETRDKRLFQRFLLHEIAFRKLTECHEKWWKASVYNILSSSPSSTSSSKVTSESRGSTYEYETHRRLSRRKVFSVVIWIGSTHDFQMILDQSLVLRGESVMGSDAVIGWAAMNDLYDCSPEAIKCTVPGGHRRYRGFLPRSNINLMKTGWSCAQRRPLRALAHVLALFDPAFVVLLDDDTFLNYPLLIKNFGNLLLPHHQEIPYFLGEFQGKTGPEGHVSTEGFFAGGSGYILGKEVIQMLQKREIRVFGGESWLPWKRTGLDEVSKDDYVSAQQILALSVVGEGIEKSRDFCPNSPTDELGRVNTRRQGYSELTMEDRLSVGNNSCVLSLLPRERSISRAYRTFDGPSRTFFKEGNSSLSRKELVVPIAIPLVEFCNNLMAGDNTCHHSDHSMGRCLFFAIHGQARGVTCHSTIDFDKAHHNDLDRNVKIGMCFSSPICSFDEQITCHRYRAKLSECNGRQCRGFKPKITVVRDRRERGYYSVYSSVFDGNSTDTFMLQ